MNGDVGSPPSNERRRGCGSSPLRTLSRFVTGSLEECMFRWGCLVGRRPVLVISICITVCMLSSLGLMRFHMEEQPEKLWIPQDSQFIVHSRWIERHFPTKYRHHLVIITSENVLHPSVILQMIQIHEAVTNITVGNLTWSDICAKLPQVKGSWMPLATSFVDPFSLISNGWLSMDTYCGVLEGFPKACWARGIPELFNYNSDAVRNLSLTDVLIALNDLKHSPVYGLETEVESFLGGIERDFRGRVIGAKAAMLHFVTEPQDSKWGWVGGAASSMGAGNKADPVSEDWENQLVHLITKSRFPPGIEVSVQAAKSFGDITEGTIEGDIPLLLGSCLLMYCYIFFVLGRLNMVEQRVYLSGAGLLSIAMSVLTSISLCSLVGLPYSPIHNLLALLIQGLGVDDMFVILQSWNNLQLQHWGSNNEKQMTPGMSERIGETLRHAGVSITVTSLTDFAAFLIGASTILPCLSWFCIYAAVGILITYAFQVSFFVACFSLDNRRIEARRNGIMPCVMHSQRQPDNCFQKDHGQIFFGRVLAPFILRKPIKILVLAFTAGMLGMNLFGITKLRQEFELSWFIPQGTYISRFLRAYETHYSERGKHAHVFLGALNYSQDLPVITKMEKELAANHHVLHMEAWFSEFRNWSAHYYKQGLEEDDISEEKFSNLLSNFLHSPQGARHRGHFHFDGNLTCGVPAPKVLASSIDVSLRNPGSSKQKVQMMHETRKVVERSSLSGDAFMWSWYFSGWETDEFIGEELMRNLVLASLAILVVTLCLIAHIFTCTLVLFSVLCTLVDVAGCMFFWGLTIEVVTSLNLILGIGLCVDYSAHIGHTFMTCRGTRDERAAETLEKIGNAVFHGGFSTLLSFVLLSTSSSYVFSVFFKEFFLTTVFGLYHGLVFLPVVLSIVGPEAYTEKPPAWSKRDRKDRPSSPERVLVEYVSVV